jgi:glycosyltransferase involved in cell wall biosynthesis
MIMTIDCGDASGKISVIMPVYNVEKYLAQCLNSILSNTYRDLEIICVNDGSKDASLSILNEYAEKDDRIVVISQENQGQAAARNVGLDRAHGEYIAFVDSDDCLHHRYFEMLMKPMLESRADISVACHRFFHDGCVIEDAEICTVDFKKLGSIDDIFDNSEVRNVVWGKILRKDFIKDERFVPSIKFEDKCFCGLLLSKRETPVVYFSHAPIYYYRANPSGTMNTVPYIKMLDSVDIFFSWLSDPCVMHKKQLLDMAVRILVVARYYTPNPEAAAKERIKTTEKRCCSAVREFEGFSKKEKLYLLTLIKCPIVYKLERMLKK